MKFTVESVEDNIARLESDENEAVFVNSSLLPSEVKEGDILSFDGENYKIDTFATEARRKEIYKKFNRLFGK